MRTDVYLSFYVLHKPVYKNINPQRSSTKIRPVFRPCIPYHFYYGGIWYDPVTTPIAPCVRLYNRAIFLDSEFRGLQGMALCLRDYV